MGIPFYFSYIVKNHSEIIKKLNIKTNNFFLDCNSIIYDVVNSINYELKPQNINNYIIDNVIKKIEDYINIVSPDKFVYIAFDGVAPVAKLKQQKERRYKSWFQNEINIKFKNEKKEKFNTCQITPGTIFMEELNKKIFEHFNCKTQKPETQKPETQKPEIMVSTSSEYGEGEHKIFDFIRRSNQIKTDDVNLIYGLDADLIMLCINHLPLFPNTYLFRETPEFIKNLDDRLEPNSHYYLDIPELAEAITTTMNDTTNQSSKRVYDYIFICFLLGNDFMPHFPAINIRTGGIHKLLEAYKEVFGKDEKICITDGKIVYWKNLRKLIQYLANKEELYIIKEIILRDSMENRNKISITEHSDENTKLKQFEIIPILERDNEKYINPKKIGWQKRYYEVLFNLGEDITEENKKNICMNYLEGLEWTMKYYTSGCVNYRWCYKYNYPPLLVDLLQHIPVFERDLINTNNKTIHPYVQLSYVLPRDYLSLLPEKIHKILIKERSEWFSTDYDFEWSFCKYFWESHVLFNEKTNLEELENFVETYIIK